MTVPKTCPEARRKAEERAGGRCENCNDRLKSGWYHAHHVTYERHGEDMPEDLRILCVPCHAEIHPHLKPRARRGPPKTNGGGSQSSKRVPKDLKVRCPECREWVASGAAFGRHCSREHPDTWVEEPPTLRELEKERRERERKRLIDRTGRKPCESCDKVFATSYDLYQHVRDKHP